MKIEVFTDMLFHARQRFDQTTIANDTAKLKMYLLAVYGYGMGISIDSPTDVLVRRAVEKPGLSLPNVGFTQRHNNYLLYILLQSTISNSSISGVLSHWDTATVAYLLAFISIKITAHTIKAAARNLQYGKDIMELLLEAEQEDQGSESYV